MWPAFNPMHSESSWKVNGLGANKTSLWPSQNTILKFWLVPFCLTQTQAMSGALCSDSSGNSHMLSCVCLECLCFDLDYRTPKGVETVAKRQYSRSKTWCMLLFGDKLIWTDFLETFATLEIKFLWTQEKVWPRNFLHIYFLHIYFLILS